MLNLVTFDIFVLFKKIDDGTTGELLAWTVMVNWIVQFTLIVHKSDFLCTCPES